MSITYLINAFLDKEGLLFVSRLSLVPLAFVCFFFICYWLIQGQLLASFVRKVSLTQCWSLWLILFATLRSPGSLEKGWVPRFEPTTLSSNVMPYITGLLSPDWLSPTVTLVSVSSNIQPSYFLFKWVFTQGKKTKANTQSADTMCIWDKNLK